MGWRRACRAFSRGPDDGLCTSHSTTYTRKHMKTATTKNKDCDKVNKWQKYFVLHLNSILKLSMMRINVFCIIFLNIIDKERLINHLISNNFKKIVETFIFNGSPPPAPDRVGDAYSGRFNEAWKFLSCSRFPFRISRIPTDRERVIKEL